MIKKILRFEITDRCNQRCSMCWSTDWKHNDMSWYNIKKMIIEYSKLYPKGIIVLTSREPLLSPSFENVLSLCKQLDIKLKLLTNGVLLNDHNCELIVNSTINFISISIHGDEKMHNMIVRTENSYQKTLEGIKRINEYKEKYHRDDLDLRITTVINDRTLENIDDIIEICKNNNANLRIQHLMWHNNNIKSKHKQIIKKKFNYEDDIIDGFLSIPVVKAEYVVNTINKARKMCEDYNVDLQIYPDLNEDDIINWYSNNDSLKYDNAYCDHVSESVRIRANGDVSLCQYIDKYCGNVYKDSLEKILSSNEYKDVSNNLMNGNLFPICYHCCHLRNKIIEEKKKI